MTYPLPPSLPPSRVLSQIFVFDLPAVITVKFNPKKGDLVQYVLPKMPALEQLPSLTEDKDTLKLCKTCKEINLFCGTMKNVVLCPL